MPPGTPQRALPRPGWSSFETEGCVHACRFLFRRRPTEAMCTTTGGPCGTRAMTGENGGRSHASFRRVRARALERAENRLMADDELTELRARAADGDGDAVAQLVELAG